MKLEAEEHYKNTDSDPRTMLRPTQVSNSFQELREYINYQITMYKEIQKVKASNSLIRELGSNPEHIADKFYIQIGFILVPAIKHRKYMDSTLWKTLNEH